MGSHSLTTVRLSLSFFSIKNHSLQTPGEQSVPGHTVGAQKRPTDGMKTGRCWRGGGEKQQDVGGVEERIKPCAHLRTFPTQTLRLVVHVLVPET